MIVKEMLAGYASRIRLENSLQLQKAKETRPLAIREEIAKFQADIDERLAADPKLKARFDKVKLVLPEGI